MSVKELPVKVPDIDGAIDLIFGEFGGGKNVLAYRLAIDALRRGIPVYCSFPMKFEGVDERKSLGAMLMGIAGLKKTFTVIEKENFHHLTMKEIMSDAFVEKLKDLVECLVIVDEAYAARLFDSYRKTNLSVEARMAIYATRHFDRRFIIVAQRPNAVHVSSRSMVNRFYRCTQPLRFTWALFGFRMFIITEYQDMIDESVDMEKPYRIRIYFAGKSRLSGFDSKYMRNNAPNKYPSKFYKFRYGYIDIWKEFIGNIRITPLNNKKHMKTPTQSEPGAVLTAPGNRSVQNIHPPQRVIKVQ